MRLYDLASADAERRFSPYCWRIRMALAHRGLAAEYVPWRFHGEGGDRCLGSGPRAGAGEIEIDAQAALGEAAGRC